jgi:membrane-associated phospholipid phosphatase
VKKVGTLNYGIGIIALAMFLAASLQTAGAQQFSTKAADCVTLECAAAAPTSYSFGPPGNSQESSSNTTPRPATETAYVREGRWRKLPGNFVHDQKDMWLTFPHRLAQGHYWLPTALLTGATAALIYTDPKTMPYFRRTDFFQDSDHAINSSVSGGIIAAVPATFYLVSLLRKDSYGQATSLLAGEAVVDDTILMIVTKAITRRERPTNRAVQGDYNDTFFNSHAGPLGKASSFPSGHAMMSFSIATIFAHRYRQHRWVPWVAYSVAAAISFSRITTGAHFPSDVLFGAATGFAIARFGVLHGQ